MKNYVGLQTLASKHVRNQFAKLASLVSGDDAKGLLSCQGWVDSKWFNLHNL